MAGSEVSPSRCSRVHFSAEQVNHHDSEIIVREVEGGCKCLDVHLGFLQLHHEYKIEFDISDDLGSELTCDPLQSLNVKLLEAIANPQGHSLRLSLKAEKDRLMKEEMVIVSATEPSSHIKLILHARVLGQGKGTPALKSGIHLTKSNLDEDSHASDWSGFE